MEWFRTPKKIVSAIFIFAVFLIVLIEWPIVSINSTERWIVYRRWAVVWQLWEGLHFITPFADSVKTVKITPTQLEINIPVAAAWAITKDNQTIGADISIFFKYKESELINISKNYWFNVLNEKLQKDTIEAFKQVVWQYTIFDVAYKQEEIRVKVLEATIAKIASYPTKVDDIKISNYDWSESFDQQIALTMQIAQEAKQQEQQLKKVEIEAQQAVKKAEANKQAEALNAEALELKWEWIRKYNQAITSNPKNMELEIRLKELEIEKLRVEKRNGIYVPINNYWPIPVSTNTYNQGQK